MQSKRRGAEKTEDTTALPSGPTTTPGEMVFGVAHIFASFNDTFVVSLLPLGQYTYNGRNKNARDPLPPVYMAMIAYAPCYWCVGGAYAYSTSRTCRGGRRCPV